MLALARGEGQSIIIDGHIEVKIVKWSRSSVRLAIQAPREIAVDRDEIWRRMHPGELTPLEKAEAQRRERLDREKAAGQGSTPPGEGVAILAPIDGVFHASAGPGGAPFVTPGSPVDAHSVVGTIRHGEDCLDVHAGVAGTVLKIASANGQHVEKDQVLVWLKASAGN